MDALWDKTSVCQGGVLVYRQGLLWPRCEMSCDGPNTDAGLDGKGTPLRGLMGDVSQAATFVAKRETF